MTGDFERDLAAALDRAAARAPLDAPEWIEPAMTPAAPSSTARVLGAAAVVAALVGGTTALVVTRVDDTPAVRTVASTPAEPEGTEVRLERVPVPDDSGLLHGSYAWPLKPGSIAAVRLGDDVLETYVEMRWTGMQSDTVTSEQCVIGAAIDVGPCVRVGSGEPRVFRDGTFIILLDVPDNVAYVEVSLDDDLFWQRPVHGVMAMPDRPDAELGIQAIGADGTRATVKYLLNEEESVAGTPQPEVIPPHLTHEVHAAASLTARECIEAAGFDDPTAPIPAGVDVDEIWTACLHEAAFAAAHLLDPPPPEGTEVALDPLPLSPTDWFAVVPDPGPVRPGSVVGVQVDGTTVVAYASLGPGGAAIAESRCAGFDGTTGCTLARQPVTVSWLSDSRQSLMFLWVPDDVEFVAFEFDEDRYWQRPIDGFAAVPNQQYEQLRVVGIGAGGEETILFEDPPATIPAPDVSDPPVERVPVTGEVEEVAFGAAQACLDEAGLGDPFAPVPEGVDADAIWHGCMGEAERAAEMILNSMTTEPPPPEGTEVDFHQVEVTPELAELFEGLDERPIRPGSLVAAEVEGEPVVIYTTLSRTAAGVEMRCGRIGPDAPGGCAAVAHDGSVPRVFVPAGDGGWIWLGVPARTVYVRASIDGERLWQRPVANAAVFQTSDPDIPPNVPVAVGGGVPGGPTDTTLPPAAETTTGEPGGQSDPRAGAALDAMDAAANACLDEAGLGNPFEPIPEDVDADAVWNECVAVAAAAVEDFLAAPPATSTP